MFAPIHSALSSAGPKYGVNGASSTGYAGGSTVPARFSLHVYQKPGFGPYYPPANNAAPMKMDAGYRPSIPQPPYTAAPRYDDRYSVPHPHPHTTPIPPPRLNTTAPSNLSRTYDPKVVPVVPAPPPTRPRAVHNFNIYPGNAQDTFIYQQSQGSKSDLLSNSDFDSASSPTESIDSTITLRGANTPGTEASSLEPSPVEPTMSRRDSLAFNGAPASGSGLGGDFRPRSTAPGGRPQGAGPAFPPHMTAAMTREPSESSIDIRERIATVNAQINSASTASYYTPSPSSSIEPQPPQGPSGPHVTLPSTPQGSPPRGLPQQPIFSDTYIHSSPENVHAHIPQQPTGGRSRSSSPQQQHQQPAYLDRSSSRYEPRRSPPQQHARPTSTYGAPSSSQIRRSPSQQQPPTLSNPVYPPDDYFSPSNPAPAPRLQPQYSPNSGYNNTKYGNASSSSPPREEQWHLDPHDRRQSPPGSGSPPGMTRQSSVHGGMDRSRSSSGSGGSGYHGRYSPPEASSSRSVPPPAPLDDGYARESVPRRERKRSVSYSMGEKGIPLSYSSSSSSGSSTSTATPTPASEYRERERDGRDRDRDRERDRSGSRDRERERDRDRGRGSRRSSVYNPDPAGIAYQQQQSTIPFSKSSPPSPPNSTLRYSSVPVANEGLSQKHSGSYSSSSPPERMSSRTRTTSMSNGTPSRPSPADLSMSSLHISEREDASFSRGPRHPDMTPSHGTVPIPVATSTPAMEGEPSNVYRRRRMSVSAQAPDVGSIASGTPAATMGVPLPGVLYSDQHVPRDLPPTPHRRLSDGDRPVSSVRYESKNGQQHPPQQSQPQPYPSHPEPHRRYSDGDQNQPHPSFKQYTQHSHYYQEQQEQAARNVRWDDNLICPSPVLPQQKRKGWYNRRGDQLWTNDGMFRPVTPDQEYPADLDDYPDHGEGWMNEDGIRIDMEHRRVPKLPRRSALKR